MATGYEKLEKCIERFESRKDELRAISIWGLVLIVPYTIANKVLYVIRRKPYSLGLVMGITEANAFYEGYTSRFITSNALIRTNPYDHIRMLNELSELAENILKYTEPDTEIYILYTCWLQVIKKLKLDRNSTSSRRG